MLVSDSGPHNRNVAPPGKKGTKSKETLGENAQTRKGDRERGRDARKIKGRKWCAGREGERKELD